MLVDYWYYNKHSYHPSSYSHLYEFNDSNSTEIYAFASKFKLPFAGYRSQSSAVIDSVDYKGYYWSSSKDRNILKMEQSRVRAFESTPRAYGNSVRCFKNEYVPDPETTNLVDTQAWVEGEDFETITISNPEDSSE